jgi:hypothetical protein
LTRPGGFIAVLESDELHHVWLPWPVELEAAIQASIHGFSRRRYGRDAKLCPARVLHRQMREANLKLHRRTTIAADRIAPFDGTTLRFLRLHLEFLAAVVKDRLTGEVRRRFDELVREDSESSFLVREDAEFTCLTQLFVAGSQ